tara:strand:+ start:155 stop:856 length:702 start_codon:yes stop_codon:yes gene_type:complete
MKLLVTTRADSAVYEMAFHTHPLIVNYANKCGADFLILQEQSECEVGHGKHHFKIMELGNLLEEYDRVLCVDSDILIRDTCPNLFDVVPYDNIGTIYEDKGTRREDRHERIRLSQKQFGDVGWTEGYINTGVFLVSKPHANIFEKIDGEFYTGRGFDDVHLGYLINKYNHPVTELPYQYNHMTMFSEDWNGSPNRFDSHIIHYAGGGIFDSGIYTKVQQIASDKDYIMKEAKV